MPKFPAWQGGGATAMRLMGWLLSGLFPDHTYHLTVTRGRGWFVVALSKRGCKKKLGEKINESHNVFVCQFVNIDWLILFSFIHGSLGVD